MSDEVEALLNGMYIFNPIATKTVHHNTDTNIHTFNPLNPIGVNPQVQLLI